MAGVGGDCATVAGKLHRTQNTAAACGDGNGREPGLQSGPRPGSDPLSRQPDLHLLLHRDNKDDGSPVYLGQHP